MGRRWGIPLVTGALLAASPAWALFGNDEAIRALQAEVQALKERVDRLAFETTNGETLRQQEFARVQGAVEELRYKLEQLEKRQRDLYLDLDRRLREQSVQLPPAGTGVPAAAGAPPVSPAVPLGSVSSGTPVSSSPAVPPSVAPAVASAASPLAPATAERAAALFAQALKALQGQQAQAALRDFEAFLAQYPNEARKTEAHFWAGTAALQLKQFEKARQHFARVVFDQPRHELAPDAMLGLANALQGLGDKQGARDMLSRLVERYPNTPAGKIARERLGQ